MGSSYSFAGGGVGGGGAAQPRIVSAHVTSGVVTLPDTAGGWEVLNQADNVTPFEIAVPAAAGDWVDVTLTATYEPRSTESIDLAVVVGTDIVRFLATGTDTPSSRGLPWAHENLSTFQTPSSPIGFVVEPGDLDGGNVRFVIVTKGDGTATLYAAATFPLYWQARNLGPPAT